MLGAIFKLLAWSSNSPDPNPIKHLWNIYCQDLKNISIPNQFQVVKVFRSWHHRTYSDMSVFFFKKL